MPQLDNNTFIYQYSALITVFLVIYVLLAYTALPLTLRSLILKLKVLSSLNSANTNFNLKLLALKKTLNSTLFSLIKNSNFMGATLLPTNDVSNFFKAPTFSLNYCVLDYTFYLTLISVEENIKNN